MIAERIAARFMIAKGEVKEQLKNVINATPKIWALIRAGNINEARDLYLSLLEPISSFATALEGVVLHRKDEKNKLLKLEILLNRIKNRTHPRSIERFRELEGKELEYYITGDLETLTEILKSLSRLEGRLDDYKAIERNFKHGPFEIRNDYGFRVEEYEEPLKILEKASDAVGRAGYGKVLYGTVVLASQSKMPSRNAAGVYVNQSDLIYLNVESKYRYDAVYTIVHELGHRYWYKFLSDPQREAYEDAYSGTSRNLTVADREAMYLALEKANFDPKLARTLLSGPLKDILPEYWKLAKGIFKSPNVSPETKKRNFTLPSVKYFHFESERPTSVTDYGRTNVREDFCGRSSPTLSWDSS